MTDVFTASSGSEPPTGMKAQSKLRAQELIILETITALGLDPANLPMRLNGKAGVKSQVRRRLRGHTLFAGATVLDKAWERLRADDQIVDESKPSSSPNDAA